MRVIACLLILVAAASGIYTYYVYAADHNWDETFHVKSSLVSPSECLTEEGYAYATDHPSIKRHVYRWVLGKIGVHDINIPDVDYSRTEKWNIEAGRVPSMGIVIPLRITNAAFVVAALVLVFFTALLVLRDAYLSLAVVVPLLLSGHIAPGVVAYIGCDAILAFTLALSLFVLVALVQRGIASSLAGTLMLGVTGALALSTKFNGGLVIVAFCVYLVLVNRGIDRLFKPFIAATLCAAVFVLLNPVVRGGGIDWALGVAWDMLGRRRYIWQSQYAEFPLSRAALVARFFPWAAFLLPLAGALVRLRKEKWALPVSVWSAVLVLGTLASVNRTYARYYLPVEMAAFFISGAAAWRLVAMSRAQAAARKEDDRPRRYGIGLACGAASALILATAAAVFVPLGDARLRAGSVVGKARLFYRQSAAYYGFAEPVKAREAASLLKLAGAAPPSGQQEGGEVVLGTLARRALTLVLLIAAATGAFLAGRAALANGWLAAAALFPFAWSQLVDSRYLSLSLSEGLLICFASALVGVLAKSHAGHGKLGWRQVTVCALAVSGACAASPGGIFLAAAAAAWVSQTEGGVRKIAFAAALTLVATLLFPLLESAFWRIGARGVADWVIAIRGGALKFWTARFAETTHFLLPANECFPWWPMLPLTGAAFYAVRRERWAGLIALWLLFVLAGTILTMSSRTSVGPDVNLALSLGGGLPGLALLAQEISLNFQFKDRPGTG